MKNRYGITSVLLLLAVLSLLLTSCNEDTKEKVGVVITVPSVSTSAENKSTPPNSSIMYSSITTEVQSETSSSGKAGGEGNASSGDSIGATNGEPGETSGTDTQESEISKSTSTSSSLQGYSDASDSGASIDADIKYSDPSYGILILTNKKYRLPDGFEQSDLVDISSNYHVADGKKYKLQKEAAEAFYEMSDAAWNESGGKIDLRIISGYRSHSYQDWLYHHYVSTYGKEDADTYSARPGHSEHETGLCCDIDMVDMKYEDTDNFKWLTEHAADYGYILRYEKGKEDITGYMYEPWHWRYVGVKTAQSVKESGLSYDEYYQRYIEPYGPAEETE